ICIYELGKSTITVREIVEVVKTEHEELVARDDAKTKRVAELEGQIKKLEEMNRTLQSEVRKTGAEPSAASSIENDSAEQDQYETLLSEVKRALKPLPAVMMEAFFHSYIGERFQREPFNDR